MFSHLEGRHRYEEPAEHEQQPLHRPGRPLEPYEPYEPYEQNVNHRADAGLAGAADISTLVVPPLPRSTKIAREFVASSLTRRAYEPSVVDAGRTVVSELVTNASRHGSPTGGDVVVRVYVSDAGPVIEVHDTSPEPPVRRPFDVTAESGRGLLMLDSIVRSWGHRPLADGGKAVHAVLCDERA